MSGQTLTSVGELRRFGRAFDQRSAKLADLGTNANNLGRPTLGEHDQRGMTSRNLGRCPMQHFGEHGQHFADFNHWFERGQLWREFG